MEQFQGVLNDFFSRTNSLVPTLVGDNKVVPTPLTKAEFEAGLKELRECIRDYINEVKLELTGLHRRSVDWSACSLVEVKPGVQDGRPVLKATRMPADDIVENWEAGLDAPVIAENFRLPLEQVNAILTYATTHQHAARTVR
jgi:uncharacterized protein (DUF433 family)